MEAEECGGVQVECAQEKGLSLLRSGKGGRQGVWSDVGGQGWGCGEVTGGQRDKGDLARGHGAFLLEVIVELPLVERFVLLFSC